MCYHLCYVRSKFKKVFTSPFLLGKELKRWQQFQTKKWKSMNKTQKTSWWSPRSKKGWRGRGEGIVIKIFWSTELNDPLLDIWSFEKRWFFSKPVLYSKMILTFFFANGSFLWRFPLFWVLQNAFLRYNAWNSFVPAPVQPSSFNTQLSGDATWDFNISRLW